MTTNHSVLVIVPFCYGQHQFKIYKGRRWGAIDHLFLQEIVKNPCSAQQLAEISELPRRLIIEIMIPFMRVGWVQISQQNRSYVFQATHRGIAVASQEELPREIDPILSFRQFIIDPKTGQCYRVGGRQQTFQVYRKQRIEELIHNRIERVIELKFQQPYSQPAFSEIFECVAERDEEVIGYEETPYQTPYAKTKRYAIATVDTEQNILGVPSNLSSALHEEILKAAVEKFEEARLLKDISSSHKHPSYRTSTVSNKVYGKHSLGREDYGLVLGAEQHAEHLKNAIRHAHSRLIIHSTFINPANVENSFNAFICAAKRSVQIDILWGQIEPESAEGKKSYQETILKLQELNEKIREQGLGELFTIHTDPTGSHAKIIIYDNEPNSYCATVGSCNWLASGFNRFEASVLLRQKDIVLEIMNITSMLAMGHSKVSNRLSRELAVLVNFLRGQSESSYTTGSTDQAQIILQGEHHAFLRKARDEAKNEIFVCSHRISSVSDRPIFTPLKTATEAMKEVKGRVFYGVASGGMKQSEVVKLAEELGLQGITLEKVGRPTIHAKILTWDSCDAVITSLNWLSASASGEDNSEIGIYIKGDNIARVISDAFVNSLS